MQRETRRKREGQLLVARRAHMSPPPRVAISSPPQKVDAIGLTSSRGITRVSPLCRKPAIVLCGPRKDSNEVSSAPLSVFGPPPTGLGLTKSNHLICVPILNAACTGSNTSFVPGILTPIPTPLVSLFPYARAHLPLPPPSRRGLTPLTPHPLHTPAHQPPTRLADPQSLQPTPNRIHQAQASRLVREGGEVWLLEDIVGDGDELAVEGGADGRFAGGEAGGGHSFGGGVCESGKREGGARGEKTRGETKHV